MNSSRHQTYADEHIAMRPILLLIVGMLIIGLAAVVWSWQIGSSALPKRVAEERPSTRDHELFTQQSAAQQRIAPDLQRLHQYGWIDAEAGIAHIPIDQAMSAWLETAAAAASGE